MAEYIEKEKAARILREEAAAHYPTAFHVGLYAAARACKHSELWYGDKSRCFLWHEDGIDVFNDGFCNYGEKREES